MRLPALNCRGTNALVGFWEPLKAAQGVVGDRLELVLGLGNLTCYAVVLDVLPDPLVGVELG